MKSWHAIREMLAREEPKRMSTALLATKAHVSERTQLTEPALRFTSSLSPWVRVGHHGTTCQVPFDCGVLRPTLVLCTKHEVKNGARVKLFPHSLPRVLTQRSFSSSAPGDIHGRSKHEPSVGAGIVALYPVRPHL